MKLSTGRCFDVVPIVTCHSSRGQFDTGERPLTWAAVLPHSPFTNPTLKRFGSNKTTAHHPGRHIARWNFTKHLHVLLAQRYAGR